MKKFLEIINTKIAYIDEGKGDAIILFMEIQHLHTYGEI